MYIQCRRITKYSITTQSTTTGVPSIHSMYLTYSLSEYAEHDPRDFNCCRRVERVPQPAKPMCRLFGRVYDVYFVIDIKLAATIGSQGIGNPPEYRGQLTRIALGCRRVKPV